MLVKAFLLDVEGPLVADKRYQAVSGAVAFIAELRSRGVPFRLITNNTTDSKAAIVDKLARAGFDFTADEVHTCTSAAASHLRSRGATTCVVLGTSALRRVFVEEGFTVVDEASADKTVAQAVVVGLDTDLTYERLRLACDAVSRHGAVLIALHRNRLFVDSQGRCSPSVGAIVEAIAYATQVEPVLIGKPSPTYFQQALDDIARSVGDSAFPVESVMVVSDDPLSDLDGAKRMGMRTAFVLCGKYPDRSVLDSIPQERQPDIVAGQMDDLLTCGAISLAD